MNPMALNKKSWHYWLVKTFTNLELVSPFSGEDVPVDICTYVRHLIGAIIISILLTIIVTVATYGIGSVIYGIFVGITTGVWAFNLAAIGVMSMVAVFLLVIGVIFLSGLYQKYKDEQRYRDDGFFKQAYKSWKEKYCTYIIFKE